MGGAHHHDHLDHHAPDGRSSGDHKRRLALALGVLGALFVVEVAAAMWTSSLALLSDAGHMLTDVAGIGMALAALHLADRGSDRDDHTFGLYRLEILAALANTALLFGVAIWVVLEAVRRLDDPVEVLSGPMLAVAILGLGANFGAFLILRDRAAGSMNVEGAYLEVMADLVGSIGVVAAAATIAVTGWTWVDPAVGVAIGLFILPRTWRLAARALRILLQAAPPGVDVPGVARDLGAIPGVVDVHDLHIWTLTSDMEVATAHVMVRAGTDAHAVLDQARVVLRDQHGIGHATLQVEPDDHHGCDEVNW